MAIRVHNVSKSFRVGTHALRSVSIAIAPGECVALLGASGSGKSTLIRILAGLIATDRGQSEVLIDGRRLQHDGQIAPDVRKMRRQIGVVFQQFNLVGQISVIHNVLIGLTPRMPLWRAMLRRFSEAERLQALNALISVGLGPQAYQRASTLSGGQQQRAALARTLVQGARVLLADEPVASLDPESARRVMELLMGLNSERGITIVVSLHQVEFAQRYCARAIGLKDGEVVYDGPTAALSRKFLLELYGSEAEELFADHDLRSFENPAPPEVAALAVS